MLFTDVYEYNKLLSLIRSKAHVAYESLETQKNPIVTLESVLGLFREWTLYNFNQNTKELCEVVNEE